MWIVFSIHYSFLPGTCIAIYYGYTGYKLYTYACMRMYVNGATRAKGTNSFDGVILPDSFESVFMMENVEGVHVCVCM